MVIQEKHADIRRQARCQPHRSFRTASAREQASGFFRTAGVSERVSGFFRTATVRGLSWCDNGDWLAQFCWPDGCIAQAMLAKKKGTQLFFEGGTNLLSKALSAVRRYLRVALHVLGALSG